MAMYFFSHHKCATMSCNSIIGRVCAELGTPYRVAYDPAGFSTARQSIEVRGGRSVVAYLDTRSSCIDALVLDRAVHVIRDPRDILVSAYFSHMHSHQSDTWPELQEHRQRLKVLSQEEGLLLELEFNRHVFESLESWNFGRPEILELRFEEMISNPYAFWVEAVCHLGMLDSEDFGLRKNIVYASRGLNNLFAKRHGWWPLREITGMPAQRLLGIVFENRFEAKAQGRRPGQVDAKSHYRSGRAGGWKDVLGEEHLREMNRMYPLLLENTGYA